MSAPLAGIAAAILLFASVGCATRISIPTVSDAERGALERQLAGPSLSELEYGKSLRFWEILLTDSTITGSFTADQREELRTIPLREAASSLHEEFRKTSGVDSLVVVRTSPALVRLAAAQADPVTAQGWYAAANHIERLHGAIDRRVEEVGRRLLDAVGRRDVTINTEPLLQMNASVPIRFDSNEIYVGTEMAVLAGSDHELACVIGHELAHITEGHTESSAWADLGKQALAVTVAAAAATAMASNSGRALSPYEIQAAINMGELARIVLADVPLRLSGWERAQEHEADSVGLLYAYRAGFDPRACATLMLRLARHERAQGIGKGYWWWNIHPGSAERSIILQKLGVQAMSGTLQVRE